MTRNAAYLLSLALAFALAFPPGFALADESEDAKLTAYELQQEIEERQASYAAARAEADEATDAIEAEQERIEALEREIPEQQRRSAAAARELYKLQQQGTGIVELLLSAGSFQDFIAELEYVNKVSEANIDEMNRLNELKGEIIAMQNGLKEKRSEADARAEDARVAMLAAQEAQAEVQRRIEEEARQQAQIAAQAAAMAEQERANDSGEPAVPETGTVAEPEVAHETDGDQGDSSSSSAGNDGNGEGVASENGESDAVAEEPAAPSQDAYTGEDDYVAGWAKRIDAYLAGSPLAGQGLTFAKAAYEYGVDPRFSPAISYTESGKGQYCFNPHNAWGWGSASWDTWEEAIYDHVAGLARGYGGQISKEGAQKYCPPNWKLWYERTLAQMEMI